MCGEDQRRTRLSRDNSFVRTNGWTLPLNSLQIIAWVVLLFCGLMFFGVEALAVKNEWWPVAFVCIGVFYVIHIICLVVATSINPADDMSKLQMINRQKPIPVFDRNVHKHVIENSYCHLCEVLVGNRSKHCSACNKCVAVFDHHCKWLNNCIGVKNYRVFIATLLSALLASIGMLVLSLYVFIEAVQNSANLNEAFWWKGGGLQITFEVFIAIKLFVLIVSLLLLLQLFGFHVVLIHRNITTYDYIKKRMERTEATQRQVNSTTSNAVESDAVCNDLAEMIETPRKNDVPTSQLTGGSGITLPHQTVVIEMENLKADELPKHALIKPHLINSPSYIKGRNRSKDALSPEITREAPLASEDNHSFVKDELIIDDKNVLHSSMSPNTCDAEVMVHINDSKTCSNVTRISPQPKENENTSESLKRTRKKKKKRKASPSVNLDNILPRALPQPLSALIESPTCNPSDNLQFPSITNVEDAASKYDDLALVMKRRGGKSYPLSTSSSVASMTSSLYSEA